MLLEAESNSHLTATLEKGTLVNQDTSSAHILPERLLSTALVTASVEPYETSTGG